MMQTEPTSRFMRACQRYPVDATPIWLMRQAGRYMQEYRDLRSRYSMLDLITTPELAAQVTMQPINAFDLDAAIIFADILPPLMGMGLQLDFVAGKGPVIGNPISERRHVDQLRTPSARETLSPTLEAIQIVANELKPKGIPLIGFAGAPFTLACYAIEGGGSKDYAKAKAFMYREPVAWGRLMEKLVAVQADYLIQQAQSGAQALQVFDSWAGLALGKQAYQRYVAPYNKILFEKISSTRLPIIHFSTGASAYLEDVADSGGDVISVDFRIPLRDAWDKIGSQRAIQGNLDPMTLLAPWENLKGYIDEVLQQADNRVGHIFNLGQGIHRTTPVENVKRMVDYVHEQTRR